MPELTHAVLTEMRRLERLATPPPWPDFNGMTNDDFRLVDALRPYLPALLNEAERGLRTRHIIERHCELRDQAIHELRLVAEKSGETVADAIHAAVRPLIYIGEGDDSR